MKDKKLTIGLIFWGISAILAGFIYAFTTQEFVFRQSCEVLLLFLFMQNAKDKPISFIVLNGFFVMSALELIDELRKMNNMIRMDDYFFLFAGVIGIFIGIARHLFLKKKAMSKS